MIRLFILILLAANVLAYAVAEGYIGTGVPEGHDPARLAEQISPDKIRLLTNSAPNVSALPDRGAPAAAPKTLACVEFGGFNADDAKKAADALAALNLGERVVSRHLDDQATYIVYLPPFKTKVDADRAAAELKRIGVSDFFVIQDPGPFHLAISLGIFHSEEAAKAQATSLSQQGVKNVRTGERPSTISKTYFQIRSVDPALLARLNELRGGFPNQDLHECASSSTELAGTASTLEKVATSSSGT